ncbi:hypothetical protein M514_14573 [Trichuris suis]|uniref:Uncharacterized protein n=1 Tax=Trichuris suis TaxID=68888 RepID=A0A085NUT7_9BILA|nr:hypothetical protein M514_14573 [Trichuris suis]
MMSHPDRQSLSCDIAQHTSKLQSCAISAVSRTAVPLALACTTERSTKESSDIAQHGMQLQSCAISAVSRTAVPLALACTTERSTNACWRAVAVSSHRCSP